MNLSLSGPGIPEIGFIRRRKAATASFSSVANSKEQIMRTTIALALAASVLIAAPAFSQMNSTSDSSSPRTTTTPLAVVSPSDVDKTMAAPVAGKNSFTKSEVVHRLHKHGYSSVSSLMKDDQSIWHAQAMKAGLRVDVAVDYQGNITAQ